MIQTQETADAEPGTVINQDRAAGPVPQGSTITLTVAAAPTTVTIPDGIVGMSSEEATSALQDLGLTVRTDGAQSETVPEGDVMSVQPSAGSSVPIGSTVTITVSEGAPTSNNSGGGGNGNNAGGN